MGPEEQQLWEDYHQAKAEGDGERYKQQLKEKFLPLLGIDNIDSKDSEQEAYLGLERAIEMFDPKRDTEFRTYAYLRIHGIKIDELKKQDPESKYKKRKAKELEKLTQVIASELGHLPNYDELVLGIGTRNLDQVQKDYETYERIKSDLEKKLGTKVLVDQVNQNIGKVSQRIITNHTLLKKVNEKLSGETTSSAEQELVETLGIVILEYLETYRPIHTYSFFKPIEDRTKKHQIPVYPLLEDIKDKTEKPPQEKAEENDLIQILSTRLYTDQERQVLHLYHQRGLTMKETGAILKVSESRVSAVNSKIIKRFRAFFKKPEKETTP